MLSYNIKTSISASKDKPTLVKAKSITLRTGGTNTSHLTRFSSWVDFIWR